MSEWLITEDLFFSVASRLLYHINTYILYPVNIFTFSAVVDVVVLLLMFLLV